MLLFEQTCDEVIQDILRGYTPDPCMFLLGQTCALVVEDVLKSYTPDLCMVLVGQTCSEAADYVRNMPLGPPKDCTGEYRRICQIWVAVILAQPPTTSLEIEEVTEQVDGLDAAVRGTTKCYKATLRSDWGLELLPGYYQTFWWAKTTLNWCTDRVPGAYSLRWTTGGYTGQESWVWPPFGAVLTIHNQGTHEDCWLYYDPPWQNYCSTEEGLGFFAFDYSGPTGPGPLFCLDHRIWGGASGWRSKNHSWRWFFDCSLTRID